MASIFGGGTTRMSGANKPAKMLRVQSSIEGKAIPLGWGQSRLSGNLIWYGDFKHKGGASAAGGKGAGGGGGKGGKGGSQVKYQAAVVIAMCEGPVQSFDRIWNNQTLDSFSKLNLTTFIGDESQVAWGYLTTKHPTQALNYRGLAYMAAGPMKLGSSPALPNLTVEVTFAINTATPGTPDANPKDVILDFLNNAAYGVGFPAANTGALTLYATYCIATGLLVSPILADQTEGSQFLNDLLEATNSAAVWSGGVLNVVPYGDTVVGAYTPPAISTYRLTDNDFQPLQGGGGSGGSDPVQCSRKADADVMNVVPVEYLDRDNDYNPKSIDARDDAGIATFGLKRADPKQWHLFCEASAALMSAHLALGREAVKNQYTFTVGAEYVLLDPMDVVPIDELNLGLSGAPVRILEITENQDYTLTILAEEYLAGTGWSPPFNTEASNGFKADFNTDPGLVNAPVIWEPTYELTQGQPEIWIAVSGGASYGGCEVWISTDDETYDMAGVLDGSSRMGRMVTALPGTAIAVNGPSIDSTHTLQVDLSMVPDTQLLSGTNADALAGNTLCYVDGEYLAYQNAALVSGQVYNLTYLNRGLFHTDASASHPAGGAFVRLVDGSVFAYAITADRIGQTFHFKFLAYNPNGGGKQSLDQVVPYSYTVGGTPLTASVPDVTNLNVVYVGDAANLTWDEVSDFRAIRYELRQGATLGSAQILGSVAHPPFRIPGNGTYWVVPYATPSTSLKIYSPNPPSLAISGAVITSNVIATFDEGALGWAGIFGGSAGLSGGAVVTTGGGDIYGLADIFSLPDLFAYGGQGSGSYQIPVAHEVNIGRVAPCNVVISWAGQGQPVGQNILAIADLLAETDILGYAATANTTIYPELSVSTDGLSYGPWTKFSAGGAVQAWKFRARMQLQTNDPLTQVALTSFSFAVDVPDRTDHYSNLAVGAGGLTITFTPDHTITAAAFNGGPGSDVLPHVQGTILNAQQGDQLVLIVTDRASCTVQVINGGVGVARTVNVLAQGY